MKNGKQQKPSKALGDLFEFFEPEPTTVLQHKNRIWFMGCLPGPLRKVLKVLPKMKGYRGAGKQFGFVFAEFTTRTAAIKAHDDLFNDEGDYCGKWGPLANDLGDKSVATPNDDQTGQFR
jgi:hypothetical protein